ncbi:TPA: hypothetical protein ACH3X2_004672 [Trebouxia sp. C0005]
MSQRQRSFKLRQRRDRTFFEAMEGCAEYERLTSIHTQLPHQLIAMDPQRLGTPTAAYDLHFQQQFLQQLDPRWARKGVTAALLKAAGYSADVAVQTEFAGDLPTHLSCWSNRLGRSDLAVAKVAAPASDPPLRKLPRSIQFQGLKKAKKVKRQASKQQSGQQRASLPQLARSKAAGTQLAKGKQGLVPDDELLLTGIFPLPGGITSLPIVEGPPAALARLHPAPSPAAEGLGSILPAASSASMSDAASPLAGKRRGPESVSDVESLGAAEASSADSLALVPLTPGDAHAPRLRKSSRDHKKPRPYYAASQVETDRQTLY